MKSKRTKLSILATALLLGLLAGLAVAGGSAGADPGTSTDSTTVPTTSTTVETTIVPTTTTVETTTVPTTTTVETTTVPTTTTVETTTVPSSSSTTTTTTPTSTLGSTTTSTTQQPLVEQATTQAATTVPEPTTTTTAVVPPSTAPCDTTRITCGNNAATQIAIVSQTCNANAANALINVDITTLDGQPVNNLTIRPTTNCLNELNITQIVQQLCVGCTIIVLPPPPVPPPFVPSAPAAPPVAPASAPAPAPAPAPERVMAYCMPNPVARPDGTIGTLIYLDEGQPSWDATYAVAIPATYVPGYGMTCPAGSAGPTVPIFTLTVPASFVGQFVNLCIQPSDTRLPPLCHSVRIDAGATISIPVTANVRATVTRTKLAKSDRPKSAAAVARASKTIAGLLHVTSKRATAGSPKNAKTKSKSKSSKKGTNR